MPLPPRVVKYTRNGVEFTSSVDRTQYLLSELTRAALREVGIFVSRECNKKAMALKGMKRSKRVRGKSSAFNYWVRKRETDLQVGIKHDSWYGVAQELGTPTRGGIGSGIKGVPGPIGASDKDRVQPRRGFLRGTVYDNIPMIRQIEAQYLSAIEDELAAEQMIDESEGGPADV